MAIMISIKPEWAVKIAHGEKTIEIRKTKPKCTLPCKVYICMTMGGIPKQIRTKDGQNYFVHELYPTMANGRVIAEFTLKTIDTYWHGVDCADVSKTMYYIKNGQLAKTCLAYSDLEKYGKGKTLYGWHIDDLQVYDKPRNLADFSFGGTPQSWQYFDEKYMRHNMSHGEPE